MALNHGAGAMLLVDLTAMSMSAHRADAPEVDLDLFAEASLRDPFEDYRTIRDAAPAVRLRRPEIYAIGRFADVQAALRAPEALISGKGVGFNDIWNSGAGTNVLQMDGEIHARLRATIMRPLAPAKLREARADLKRLIAAPPRRALRNRLVQRDDGNRHLLARAGGVAPSGPA